MKTIPTNLIGRLSVLAVGGILIIGAAMLRTHGPDPTLFPTMAIIETEGQPPIWFQSHEVTIADWNRCYEDGSCSLYLRPPPRAKEGEIWPATGLSYVDVSEYITWLNHQTGHDFRLPTAAEWYQIANPVLPATPDPIFTDPDLAWASTYLTENLVDRRLRPSGAWSATADGIWDLDGNVWEWTQDCFKGDPIENCPAFVVGGEHEAVIPYLVRDPARGGCAVGTPPPHLGLRLVSDTPIPNAARY